MWVLYSRDEDSDVDFVGAFHNEDQGDLALKLLEKVHPDVEYLLEELEVLDE